MGMELDILRGCEIAPVDETIDLDNVQKFIKLEPTQGQKMQISALMNQLPALIGVSTLSKTMMLRFPEGVQGTLMQLKSNGGYTTTLKSLETGKSRGLLGWSPQLRKQSVSVHLLRCLLSLDNIFSRKLTVV